VRQDSILNIKPSDPWAEVVESRPLSSDEETILDGSDEEIRSLSFKEDLAQWAIENQIRQNATDALLKLLHEHGNDDLPMCAKTLLKTTRTVLTCNKSGMEYAYLGIENQIVHLFNRNVYAELDSCDTVELSLNIDGIPLFNSSSSSLWPVYIVSYYKLTVQQGISYSIVLWQN
jgi:hypothetical protein